MADLNAHSEAPMCEPPPPPHPRGGRGAASAGRPTRPRPDPEGFAFAPGLAGANRAAVVTPRRVTLAGSLWPSMSAPERGASNRRGARGAREPELRRARFVRAPPGVRPRSHRGRWQPASRAMLRTTRARQKSDANTRRPPWPHRGSAGLDAAPALRDGRGARRPPGLSTLEQKTGSSGALQRRPDGLPGAANFGAPMISPPTQWQSARVKGTLCRGTGVAVGSTLGKRAARGAARRPSFSGRGGARSELSPASAFAATPHCPRGSGIGTPRACQSVSVLALEPGPPRRRIHSVPVSGRGPTMASASAGARGARCPGRGWRWAQPHGRTERGPAGRAGGTGHRIPPPRRRPGRRAASVSSVGAGPFVHARHAEALRFEPRPWTAGLRFPVSPAVWHAVPVAGDGSGLASRGRASRGRAGPDGRGGGDGQPAGPGARGGNLSWETGGQFNGGGWCPSRLRAAWVEDRPRGARHRGHGPSAPECLAQTAAGIPRGACSARRTHARSGETHAKIRPQGRRVSRQFGRRPADD